MRIAHLSDLHVLGDDPVPLSRYLNKRFTGYVNLKYRRHAVHKRAVVQALARAIRAHEVDHVVITGDISNLALETEFEAAKALLAEDLRLDPRQVSIVPGNHDVYTSGSARKKRFATLFEEHLVTDLPDVATAHASGPFPYVQLRGDAAIIGLSSALPRPPFIAAGEVGPPQLAALARILTHPEVVSRTPVVLLHHPPINPVSQRRTMTNGLWDAKKLRETLSLATGPVLVLHGHLHERTEVAWKARQAEITASGATSASLLHDHGDRMAGYNVYTVDAGVVAPSKSFVFEASSGRFLERSIPRVAPRL